MRGAVLLLLLGVAATSFAGTIEVISQETYDTGLRRTNGQWRIGAAVKMRYMNIWGEYAQGDWQTLLAINNIHNGSLLAGTGWQEFQGEYWNGRIEAWAGFDSCYQGKAFAKAGGDVREAYANHVCTDPRPLSDDPTTCPDMTCNPSSPIIISLHGRYELTSAANGVRFDIDADGTADRVAWTAPGSGLAFLAMDRNDNGRIDDGAELFGDNTRLAHGTKAVNGFEALAELDLDRDGTVSAPDPAWSALVLWFDTDHDGRSSATELVPIRETGITAIRTSYRHSGRHDQHGNLFAYRGAITLQSGERPCYDVFLETLD